MDVPHSYYLPQELGSPCSLPGQDTHQEEATRPESEQTGRKQSEAEELGALRVDNSLGLGSLVGRVASLLVGEVEGGSGWEGQGGS